MVRNEIVQDSVRVAYGHDEATGYFISVDDMRLAVNEETGDDFDNIRYNISPDGTGTYLSAHTGTLGFGARVSYSTMEKLWHLYQVGEAGLKLLAEKRNSL